MAASKTQKDGASTIGKKSKKAAVAQRNNSGSMYALIADIDGNAKNAKDFDEIPHTEDEVFFMVNDELTGHERKVAEDRVELLNFIHKELYYSKIARHVPAPAKSTVDDTEIFHQADYNGRKIDVGVHFYQGVNQVWTARAFVKFADAELDDDEYGITIWADHAANAAEVKKDKGSKVVAGLSKFYWAPRWNYVVRYLRQRMEAYTCDGSQAIEVIEPTAPTGDEAEDENDSGGGPEEPMEVPSGCTGLIIGKAGAKINELKDQTGVEDIKLPERTEPRPKARELVTITIIGKKSARNKARVLIQEIVDEWKNAPRPPRDGGGGFQQPSQGFAQNEFGGDATFEASQDNANNDDVQNSWADSANNAADANPGGGGDLW